MIELKISKAAHPLYSTYHRILNELVSHLAKINDFHEMNLYIECIKKLRQKMYILGIL